MTDRSDDSPELDVAEIARRGLETSPTRVVIIGGGVAGLVAAHECLQPGFDVTIVEASEALGGCVAAHEVAGLRLDAGAESFATRGGHVAALISELGLGAEIVTPNPAGAWVRLPNQTVPLPKAGLLGIPSSPLAQDVVRAIGWTGALRAYLDRLMPVLKIGEERSLGVLVRKRMGKAVLERLVAPVATGVYSAQADDLDVAVVAPGLNAALTRQGSLSGAVAELRTAAKAGSAVGGINGGMARLVDRLAETISEQGGRIERGVAVRAVGRIGAAAELSGAAVRTDGEAEFREGEVEFSTDDETESVAENETEFILDGNADSENRSGGSGDRGRTDDSRSDGTRQANRASLGIRGADPAFPDVWHVTLADGRILTADVVLLATSGPVALGLMGAADPSLAPLDSLGWPPASSVELATLVLDDPALDSAPRGTGVLVAEGAQTGVTAKALTHATAKWPWLARAAVGRNIVRLSYGRAGRPSATHELDDSAFQELARADAETLLGMPVPASTVVGFARTSWNDALPYAAVGQRDRIARVREAVDKVSGIEVTGAWLVGTGLASVVPDAKEAAHRVRGLRWKALTENP